MRGSSRPRMHAASFPEYISDDACGLLKMMLVPDPRKRASLDDVMRHPWLAAYHAPRDDDEEGAMMKQVRRAPNHLLSISVVLRTAPTASRIGHHAHRSRAHAGVLLFDVHCWRRTRAAPAPIAHRLAASLEICPRRARAPRTCPALISPLEIGTPRKTRHRIRRSSEQVRNANVYNRTPRSQSAQRASRCTLRWRTSALEAPLRVGGACVDAMGRQLGRLRLRALRRSRRAWVSLRGAHAPLFLPHSSSSRPAYPPSPRGVAAQGLFTSMRILVSRTMPNPAPAAASPVCTAYTAGSGTLASSFVVGSARSSARERSGVTPGAAQNGI
ncbi:hypothetical protein K438DRAFT_1983479 [Mycena galopus ATCC 62051]|nr:hypothetical protein K438DRAFT_1983479 [Mycena galopus ATCC 62051]